MRRSLTGLAMAAVLVAPLSLMPTTGSGSPAAAAPGEEPRIAFTADQDSLHEVDVSREVSDSGVQSFEPSYRHRYDDSPTPADPAPEHQGEASEAIGSAPIYVSTADEEHGEIYASSDGLPVRVTCNDAVETHPVEEPGGSSDRIAFASNADGDWDIYVASPPPIIIGAVPEAAAAAGPPDLCNPAWSLTKITPDAGGPADDTWPTWTADGQLVFSSTRDDPLGDIYHAAERGDAGEWPATRLTNSPGVADTQPAVTEISTGVPTGCEEFCPTDSCNDDDFTNTWVAFTTTRYRPDGSIGLLNIDRPALGVLDAWDGSPNQSSEPSWSPCPEDQHLAFTSTQHDPYGDVAIGAIQQPRPGDGPAAPEVLPALTTLARVGNAPGVAESHPTWTNRFGPGTDGRDDSAMVLFTSRTADSSAFDEPVAPPPTSGDGVDPSMYTDTMAPGEAVTIDKFVDTPLVTPDPDIVFLADNTGSMGGEIANVQKNAGGTPEGELGILDRIRQVHPGAQFAVASFHDVAQRGAFILNQQLTDNRQLVLDGINKWTATGGLDPHEDWIGALGLTPQNITFRPDTTRIVVMFGDAPSHKDSAGFTLESAISALQAKGVRVIAIGVPGDIGLDFDGQATQVTQQTSGSLSEANAATISQKIIDEVNDLPTAVTHSVSCEDGLTSEPTPASQTVQTGNTARFQETITVSPDAALGDTLTCEVSFLINGQPLGPEFVQTVQINVEDLRSPTHADIDDVYGDLGEELGTDRRTVIADSGTSEPVEFPYDEAGPAYSPDGTKIAYSRDIPLTVDSEPRARELWVANADGTDPQLLLPAGLRPQGAVDVDPVWSPDGTRVAFTRFELSEFGGHSDPRVMVANPAAGTVHTVTVPPGEGTFYEDQDPSWSPDGRFIVLARDVDTPAVAARAARRGTPNVTPPDQLRLWVVDASGNGDEAQLQTSYDCGGGETCNRSVPGLGPAWSLDGANIAYSDRGALRLVKVDPAGPTAAELNFGLWLIQGKAAVTGFADADNDPFAQGGPPTVSRGTISAAEDPAWSPDGTTLAFAGQPAGQPDQRGIWTIKTDGTGLRPVTDLHPPGSAEEERYDDTRGPETEPAWQPDFRADVAVTVAISGSPAAIGAPVTVTWKLTNNGPTTAQNVVLATSYTAGGTAAAVAPPAGCQADGSGCTLPTLASGSTVTYQVQLTYAAAVNGTATGTVSTTSPDPDLTNNKATGKYQVDPDAPPPPDDSADLAVSVALDEAIGYVGGRRKVTFTVTNRGPDTAADVQLTAAYAEVFSEIGPTCFADDAACALGDFPAGTTKRFTVGVRTPTAGSGLISARVKTTTDDPRLANNHDQIRLPVKQPTIRVLPSVARPGMVVLAYGENMPPGSRVRLVFDRGITVDRRSVRVDRDGKIRASLLVVRRDLLGARLLQARSVTNEFSMVEGDLLVVLRLQSGTDLIGRG